MVGLESCAFVESQAPGIHKHHGGFVFNVMYGVNETSDFLYIITYLLALTNAIQASDILLNIR
jgi:hypothetical protein